MGVRLFATWYGWLTAILIALVCSFALSKGERIERVGASAFLVAWLLTLLIGEAFGNESQGNWLLFMVDLGLLTAFAAIVWKAPRNWPIWACACQVLIVASQIIVLSDIDTPMISYVRVVNMASFGILIAIAVGTFMAWQEKLAIRGAGKELGGYS